MQSLEGKTKRTERKEKNMNKKTFKQRLLSIVLAMVMVVTMLPTTGLVTAKAADDGPFQVGDTIYFDTNDVASFEKDGATPQVGFKTGSGDSDGITDSSGVFWHTMTWVSGNLYAYTIQTQDNPNTASIQYVKFKRNYDVSQTTNLQLSSNNNTFKIKSWSYGTGESDGYWYNYTPIADVTVPDQLFYVNADLVDYYNDARVEAGDTATFSTNNQGNLLGDKGEDSMDGGVAFSYLNGKISEYYSKKSTSIPLYFGALLFVNNRVGRTTLQTGYSSLARWNSTANVALTTSNQDNTDIGEAVHNTDASVQGLVNNTLDGGILRGVDGAELPFFSKTLANNWKIGEKYLMKYYEGYKFPFKVESINGSNVKKYSYDSATDYSVTLDSSNTNNKNLVASGYRTKNNDGTAGYYPFNRPGELVRSNVNYGFGTKFTIQFTVNKNGTIEGTKDGKPITFEFTGDDDVWVFIDNKLVLDMGGAHGKASGVIDFKTLQATAYDAATATVTGDQMISGNSNVPSAYQNIDGLTNFFWDVTYDQERSKVATSDKVLDFATTYGADFANSFKDSSKTHTLVMYYMERGMYDSNMKVEFTINPLPSGLSLSKSLDASVVNEGLREAVQVADNDNFAFEILTKNLVEEETSYSAVSNLGYTLNDYNNHDTSGNVATNSVVTGVGARSFAHTFINTSTGKDAFAAGTGFKITEQTNTDTVLKYDYTKTKWTVYDKQNNYAIIKSGTVDANGIPVATFDMGSSTSTEFDTYDYDVNFKNTPKVGTLTVEKKWDSNQTAPSDGTYSFTVKIKLGNGEYVAYPLDGDIVYADENGTFTLTKDQKVTFEGIPQGASYEIVENISEGAGYSSDKDSNKVTGTIPVTTNSTDASKAEVTFTNKTTVGSLSLTKKWKEGQTAPSGEYNFTVSVDGSAYANKAYTSSVDGRSGSTDAEGKLNLQVDETVTFIGIPEGSSYTIVENISGDAAYESNQTSNTATGTIKAAETVAVTFENTYKTKTVNKVIYVEAGRTDGTNYKVTDTDGDGKDINVKSVTGVEGITVTENDSSTINVKTDNSNKQYDIKYTGSKEDGTSVSGTITVYTVSATNKVYVFDYGLKSNLAATNANGDGLFQGGVFHNDAAEATTEYKTTATLGDITDKTENSNSQTSISNDAKGSLIEKINKQYSLADEKEVWFTPDAFMSSVDEYVYTANIVKAGETLDTSNPDPEKGTVVNGTIKVMPASTVYYEDNFNTNTSSDNSSVKIIYSGSTKEDGTTPSVALEQSNDQSEQYGHDSEYADDTTYSGETATVMSKDATATFTFTGTGFDIISRVNNETATIGVKVYNAAGELEKNIPLITYYDNGNLYQVPVIHENDLGYGEHKVVITVKSYNPDDVVFYLDGIRIYNPLGETPDDYLESEYMATDREIRPLILSSTVSGGTDTVILCKYATGEDGNVYLSAGGTYVEVLSGAVPEGSTQATGDMNQYWKWGPNNELYLEQGNAVAFLIDKETYDVYEEAKTLQVAAKLENGSSASLSAITTNGAALPVQTVSGGTATDVTSISTAATMYYHVPVTDAMVVTDGDTEYYQIILANTSSSAESRLSITNIKCCVDPESFVVPSFASRSRIAGSMYNAFTTEDENVRSATFSGKVLRGKTATLSVTTSTGVDGLCIVDQDGNTVTPSSIKNVTKTMNNGDVVYIWTVKFTAPATKGSYTYHVSAIKGAQETITIGEPVLTVK